LTVVVNFTLVSARCTELQLAYSLAPDISVHVRSSVKFQMN